MHFKYVGAFLLSAIVASLLSMPVRAAEPVRLASIEPLSGTVAGVGLETADNVVFSAEWVNAHGGVLGGRKIEVTKFDNANDPEKTTQQLKKAIDMGIRYVTQGTGSNNAINIIEYLDKHNKRNPDKSVLYMNFGAVTTSFTNEQCSFWHFRFDANVDMKVAALVAAMDHDPKVKRVYLNNMNYAFGKSVQEASNTFIKERAKRLVIVADDIIPPFGKVQDFTPYVAKMKAENTDTVLTGNWGPDIARFVKAVASSGQNVQFFTLYAGVPSAFQAFGVKDGMAVHTKQVTEYHANDGEHPELKAFLDGYLAKYKRTWYFDRIRFELEMFAQALNKAGSDDPKAVALAMEGMTFPGPRGEQMVMRATDHQIQLPMVISEISDSVKNEFIYDGVNLHMGWKTDNWIPMKDISLPTTCKMQRP